MGSWSMRGIIGKRYRQPGPFGASRRPKPRLPIGNLSKALSPQFPPFPHRVALEVCKSYGWDSREDADSLGRAAPSWSLQGDLFLRRPLHLPGGTHGVPGMVGSLSALRADRRGEPSGLSLSPRQFSRARRSVTNWLAGKTRAARRAGMD